LGIKEIDKRSRQQRAASKLLSMRGASESNGDIGWFSLWDVPTDSSVSLENVGNLLPAQDYRRARQVLCLP
jgi:hypothetical protein